MIDLRQRADIREWMDGDNFTFEDYRQCLHGIAKLNRLTRSYPPILNFLKPYAELARETKTPLRILDVGFGAADLLWAIQHWAQHGDYPVELVGIDLHPWAERIARENPKLNGVELVTGDVLSWQPEQPVDIVLSVFVAHHLQNSQIRQFVDWQNRHARKAWLIADIHRHWLPYYTMKHWTRWRKYHPIIQSDAPISVQRSWRLADWRGLLQPCGGWENQVNWVWPFKYHVIGRRHGI